MKALKFLQSVMNEVTAPLRTELKETTPVGVVQAYYGIVPPKNYLLCDGSEFDKDKYPDLFALLGGNTTPDLRNRTVIGSSATNDFGTQSNGALPEIEGYFTSSTHNNSEQALVSAYNGTYHYYGSFFPVLGRDSPLGRGYIIDGQSTLSPNRYALGFKASKSSSLYKDDQSYVEPANIRMSYIIRAKA